MTLHTDYTTTRNPILNINTHNEWKMSPQIHMSTFNSEERITGPVHTDPDKRQRVCERVDRVTQWNTTNTEGFNIILTCLYALDSLYFCLLGVPLIQISQTSYRLLNRMNLCELCEMARFCFFGGKEERDWPKDGTVVPKKPQRKALQLGLVLWFSSQSRSQTPNHPFRNLKSFFAGTLC